VRVAVEGADGGWLERVPAAELVSRSRDGALVVALRDGATPDDVLDAARGAGAVTHFSLERPTLTELFRQAVAA
jgi:ABC-2 type transport system ATP-binding protein